MKTQHHTQILHRLFLLLNIFSAFCTLNAQDIPQLNWSEKRSDWLNVKTDVTPAALGNGTADDTAALQAALNRINGGSEGPKVLYFPPGTYRITSMLTIGSSVGGMLVGHGRDSILRWDGGTGATAVMLRSNGAGLANYRGLAWDGANKARYGIWHNATDRFENQIRHEDQSFRNFTEAGLKMGPQAWYASSECEIINCLFENNNMGVSIHNFNFYNEVITGCEFRNNRVGVNVYQFGQVFVQNSHFTNSTEADIQLDHSHRHSVRHNTSTGSKRFISGTLSGDLNTTTSGRYVTVEGNVIGNWTATDGAMWLRGEEMPLVVFDNKFVNPPNNAAPIRLDSGFSGNMLLHSNNSSPGSSALISGPTEKILEVPAGTRGTNLTSPTQRFLKSEVDVSGKVFDVVRDYGVEFGWGAQFANDAKIAAAIAAAKAWGNGAYVHFPPGDITVREPILLTGANYTLSGTGYHSRIRNMNNTVTHEALVKITNPQNLRIENIKIDGGGENLPCPKILQVSTVTTGTSMTYENIWVDDGYFNATSSNINGLIIKDQKVTDRVMIGRLNGGLEIRDSHAAHIFVRFHDGWPLLVRGNRPTTLVGFLGVAHSNAAGVVISDNNDLVIGDIYGEQGQGGALVRASGKAGDPGGRLTMGAARLHAYAGSPYIARLNDYQGTFTYAHPDVTFDNSDPNYIVEQTGTRPLNINLMALNTHKVLVQATPAAKEIRAVCRDTTDILPAGALDSLAVALDHFSELGAANLQATGITLDATGPAIPTGLSATPGNTQNTVTWSPASGATGYLVFVSTTSGGPYTQLTTTPIATTSYTHSGLTNGVTYFYVVRSVNSSNAQSAASSQVSATPVSNPTAPNAPSALSATAASATQINLTWTDSSNNEIGFKIERSTAANFASSTLIATTSANATSFSDSGLTANTGYHYRVRATNGVGDSANSNVSFATTPALADPYGTPYGGTAPTLSTSGFTKIEAENFNDGGQGVAYSDADLSNNGGAYRTTGVDIEASSSLSNGHNVGWLAIGEWLAYSINVSQAGNYGLTLRLSSPNGAGRVRVEIDGFNATGDLAIPNTGNWGNYTTLASPGVTLSAGNHVVRVFVVAADFNFDHLTFEGGGSIPVVPVAPSALAGNAFPSMDIYMNWTDNSNNETGFKVERSTSSSFATFVTAGTTAANETSFTDSGLSPSTNYYYRVRATNASGESAASTTAAITTPAGSPNTPAAPSSLAATAVSASQINLTWSDNSTNETGFKIERSTTAAFSSVTLVSTTAANATSFSDTGLQSGTTYHFRVRATNAAGDSANSTATSATTTVGGGSGNGIVAEYWIGLPGEDLTTIPVTTPPSSTLPLTTLELPVNSDDNYGARVRGYFIPTVTGSHIFWLAADDTAKLWLNPAGEAESGKTQIAFVPYSSGSRNWSAIGEQKSSAFNLTAGSRYYFETLMKEGGGGDCMAVAFKVNSSVNPANNDGSHIIPEANFQPFNSAPIAPVAPAAPSAFTATASSTTQINLEWADNSTNETGFKIERSTTTDFASVTPVTTTAANATSYGNTGLTAATTYYYRVRATNAVGDSANSAPASATTQAASTSNAITVEYWTNITGEGTAAIPLATAPNSTAALTTVEIPSNQSDNYGARIRGYFVPATSGDYTFWVAADDQADLFLNTSGESAANKTKIAYVPWWTDSREWNKHSSQKSASYALAAGQRYYFEVLMKEGGGGDNLAVAARMNSTTTPANNDGTHIIPLSMMQPLDSSPPPPAAQALSAEYWTGLPGESLATIPTGTAPNRIDPLTNFEIPVNQDDNFGCRVRGYFTPATTGSYTFWIAADDTAKLWLNPTGEAPASKVEIAFVPYSTGSRVWNAIAEQRSAAYTLTAGTRYYIEALMKEGGGGDHMAVCSRLNSTTHPTNGDASHIIPAAHLSGFGSGGVVQSASVQSPFARWQSDYGIPLSVSENDDSDSDGLCDLLEYGLGTSPVDPTPQSAAFTVVLNPLTDRLELTFNRQPMSDLRYEVLAGSDLVDWSTLLFRSQGAENTAGQVTTSDIGSDAPRRFLKIAITRMR